MTYTVSGGALNSTQSNPIGSVHRSYKGVVYYYFLYRTVCVFNVNIIHV